MNEIVVHALPQTAPISAMRNRQNELLGMTKNGPVVLLSRNEPSAILISPVYWNAIAHALAHLSHDSRPHNNGHIEKSDKVSDISASDPVDSTENVDAFAAIAALAQPLGPPDLSIQFDKYTAQVLDDELT